VYNAAVKPLVGIVMGSSSDWETLKAAAATLDKLGIAHEVRVVSAHRTPDLLFEYATSARGRGLRVITAGATRRRDQPGMMAAKTSLPVLGVPVQSKALNGIDSLPRSRRCRPASPSVRSRSASPARMQRCSRRRSWPRRRHVGHRARRVSLGPDAGRLAQPDPREPQAR
jgi:phosphoribosylcarboxyaminoimidazole (NCAIR) mutase